MYSRLKMLLGLEKRKSEYISEESYSNKYVDGDGTTHSLFNKVMWSSKLRGKDAKKENYSNGISIYKDKSYSPKRNSYVTYHIC